MSLAAVNSNNMVQIPKYILDDAPVLQKKIKAFEDAEARAKAATALVGTAEEIGHLRTQVDQELELATKETATARQDADAVRDHAQQAADKTLADANREALVVSFAAEGIVRDAQTALTSASDKMREASDLETELKSLEEFLKTKEALLSKESEELDQLKQQLLAEQSVLATVREEIDKVLR